MQADGNFISTFFKLKDSVYVKLQEYDKHVYIDIRKYNVVKGEPIPTTKGITLSKEQWEELYKWSGCLTASLDALDYQCK